MAAAADRFRAYATIRVDRPVKDEKGNNVKDKDGKDVMAEVDASGDVHAHGPVPADGKVRLNAGAVKIRRIAFYKGPVASEVCVGSVEVNQPGSISVDVADAE